MLDGKSEKNRLVIADVIAKTWNDPKFKQDLIANPAKILKAAGAVGILPDVKITVLANTETKKYIVIPMKVSDAQVDASLAKFLSKLTPIPEGLEISLVQNSARLWYLVLPLAPKMSNVKFDTSHVNLAMATGYEAINLYTTANAVAEANVAAVQNAAAATEVAAAAVAVAVVGVVLT